MVCNLWMLPCGVIIILVPRTAKMNKVLSIPDLFGQITTIHSSSSFMGTHFFLQNDIRAKPDLVTLSALGDTGWYCIGANILWAMDQKLTALPAVTRNFYGVIQSCSASLYWEKEGIVSTFYGSFIANETIDLTVIGSNGTLHIKDFIIPYEEGSASFNFNSRAKFADLHIGWTVKPEEIHVDLQLPQEALMIKEFATLVFSIETSCCKPESKWAQTSRLTQLVGDAVNNSIELGFTPVEVFG